VRGTVENEHPQLYELYMTHNDPEIISQAVEMMRSLGAQTARDDPRVKRIVDHWRLSNIRESLYRFHDVFLIISDEHQSILYPHPKLVGPYFLWVNSRGLRAQGYTTLRSILEVSNTAWGMTAPAVR
jgi:hypothetical protein